MLGGTIHVLLIEDNAEHVEFLTRLLVTAAGGLFEMTSAGTVALGLEAFARRQPDVVLLDLTLPDSEGLETFLRIMEIAQAVPIVVMSGTNDVGLAIETVQLGAQDYLVKGHVDNHLLVRSLQYAIERKRAQIALQRAHGELEERVSERTAALRETNVRLQNEVAERKRAEEAVMQSNRQLATAIDQLRQAQREVVQRERMLALGRMANGIAHDFNNSLAPILGFSELLLMKPDVMADHAKARSYVDMIHTAARESARVVSRLREFYRYRDKDEVFAPIVLNDLLLSVIEMTQPRWKDQALAAGVQIEMRTEFGQVPTVPGNEAELRECIANLLFNAIDAITKKGIVTVRTEVEGRWVKLTVSDDGIGMSEEVRARCLEPFFTTKADQGTGLGLGSVYGIIRRHEGEVDIQSEPGRGTSVSMSLPIEKGNRAPEAPKPSSPASTVLRILIVEDEPLVREVLSVYLAEDHHEIVCAENGREGLEQFKKGRFDLVLTDRAMPEMNGDKLAIEIRKVRPEQKVILLTGFGDLMAGSGEQLEGIDLIVSKPFTLATLRGAIAKVTGT